MPGTLQDLENRDLSPVVLVNEFGDPQTIGDVIELFLLPDTSALADGDLAADTVMIPNAVPTAGGIAILQSVNLIDEDDQGLGLDLVFLRSGGTLGAENSAPNATDAVGRDALGWVRIGAGDYVDLGGTKIATLNGLGLMMKANPDTRNLYVAAISRGAPTYTAFGLRVQLGFVWA